MVRKKKGWLSAPVGDETLMMSVENEGCTSLNEVGGWIWALLEQPRSLDEIAASVGGEFEVELEQARADAEHFLAEMEKMGAVEIDPVDAP